MPEAQPPDFTRAIRRPLERLALVEYVASTPTLQESEHLEWKSGYDLSRKPDAGKLAKQLIGFANRDPVRSQRHFEGYAYVLLGVEAGTVRGVAAWDSADIESWLSRFVPADLAYDVHYVKVEGADVLFLEIVPPRAGDPIYCFQASTGNEEFTLAEGTIYVRRAGKTEVANASEVARLTTRAKSASVEAGLSLEIVVAEQGLSALEPETLDGSVRDAWIERERRRLMKPVPTNSILPFSPNELRSVAEFEKQVESYLSEVASDWPRFALSRHVLFNEPSLTLAVENRTDENFENVVIELSVPLPAKNIETSSALVAEAVTAVHSLTEWAEHPLTKIDRRIFGHTPSTEVSTSGDAAIVRFPPMHVYPQSTSALETLILALEPEWAASEMAIGWRATASNTRGAIAGSVSIRVSDVPDPSTT